LADFGINYISGSHSSIDASNLFRQINILKKIYAKLTPSAGETVLFSLGRIAK